MKCPTCDRRAKRQRTKDGNVVFHPCKACMEEERIRTHEIIARLSLECRMRGLPRKEK